jgi:Ca-activated chloride channel family protein
MINFAWPWFICLLPLPLLFFWLIKPKKNQHIIINASTLPYLAKKISGTNKHHRYSKILLIVGWCLFIVTMSRPQWLDAPIVQSLPSRDLLLAVDVSYSMQIKDMTLSGQSVERLDVVKSYLQSFIKQRQGDRVGIILFADHAYLMVPFTQDLKAIGHLINEVDIGLAGTFTAIGESITLAIKRTLHEPFNNKTLILLSDGRDTVNTISPLDAAALAKASGLKIYTVGIGADPSETESQSDLDEDTLEKIAQITGGQYFRARSEQDLSEIYQQINLIEPLSLKTVSYQPYTELFIWPLFCLLLVILVLMWELKND